MEALTVTAVVTFLREMLETSEFFSDLWLAGEVSNYTRSQLGHRYFSLRDPGAVIRSVLFRDDMPGMTLKDGDRVLAHGRVTIYPQRGELQFVANFVRPEGVGIEAARLEELMARLAHEGLFAPERKRPLPRFPVRIGLVTSPAGAALQDIRNVIARRWPVATLILAPAVVQGEQAAQSIVEALSALAREPALDLAIVARGGGSAEDLSAFNDERVARAIFGFPAPVVSGVGHETDETISDLVADLRAPTPSAAAERATPSMAELTRALGAAGRVMATAAQNALAASAGLVDNGVMRLDRGVPQPEALVQDVERLAQGIHTALERRCGTSRARFEGASARMAGLDPRATLARGFAIVQKAGPRKSVVSSVRKVKGGDRLDIAVADGAFWAEVS